MPEPKVASFPAIRGALKFYQIASIITGVMLLLLVADALPPVTFDLGLPGWAPTIELTVHLRAKPAPGWLRVVHSTRNLAGGYFEEDAEVWDSAGRLVAQSRQLARARAAPYTLTGAGPPANRWANRTSAQRIIACP